MSEQSNSSPNEDPVQLEISGPVAFVTLQSPPLNIFDLSMRDGLIEAITAVDEIPAIRVMVLQTSGANFSAGADLTEFGSAESIMEARRIRWDRDPWGPLLGLSIPTVAALKGAVIGSGLEMALLCDFRVSDESATFALPETKLGMLPAAGGTQSLTAAIGSSPASALVCLGESFEAAEAWERGILTVPPTKDLQGTVTSLTDQLIELKATVVANAKRAMAGATDLPLEQGLDFEKQLARQLGDAEIS